MNMEMPVAISLNSLKTTRSYRAPRIMIYGPPGMGKTSLAASFPSPVFVQIEDGFPEDLSEVPPNWNRKDHIASFGDVLSAMMELYNGDHDFQTVVIDSLDKLEPYIWAETCERNKWADIEAPGYGKGYLAADAVWRDLLDATDDLRNDRNMTTVFICHSHVVSAPDPVNLEYQRFDIRLQKRALAMFQDAMDAILFVNQDVTILKDDPKDKQSRVRGAGAGRSVIYPQPRPAFVAKNRFGMPASIQFDFRNGASTGYAALAPYLPARPETAEQKKAA